MTRQHNQLPAEIYLRLLNAINELKTDIEEVNPGLAHNDLNREIQELYDMVNSYDESPQLLKGTADNE